MEGLLSIDNLLTLIMLIVLQAVLGFDNLLYISLESKRAPSAVQARVRRWGIGLAVVFRIVLLFVLMSLINVVQGSLLVVELAGILEFDMSLHAIIVLFGGIFIMYTAVKEIWHMMSLHVESQEERAPTSAFKVIALIVMMNLVFSFDSILSAMALSDQFWVMALAIVIGGVLMIVLAEKVSEFLEKNRMYEVLGLFVLLIVGIMLVSEGGHLAHLTLFGFSIEAMNKATFYFVISVLLIIDVVQSRYQKRLLLEMSMQKEKAAASKNS